VQSGAVGNGLARPLERPQRRLPNKPMDEVNDRYAGLPWWMPLWVPQIEADEAKLRALEGRIKAVQNATETFDPYQMALAGALQVTPGLVKAEDRKALAVLQSGDEGNDQGEADEADQEETPEVEATAMSAALTEELTAARTAALRVELSNRSDVALVAILHALVSRVFYDYHHGRIEPAVEITGQRRNLVPSIKEPDACRALTGWNEAVEG
jgi:ParB family chromosome partitioning protein